MRELLHAWPLTHILRERSGGRGSSVSVSRTRPLLVGKSKEAGSFASWHFIGALAESDYLMTASTDSAMYGAPGVTSTTASMPIGIRCKRFSTPTIPSVDSARTREGSSEDNSKSLRQSHAEHANLTRNRCFKASTSWQLTKLSHCFNREDFS